MTPILDDTDEYLFHRGHVIRIDFDDLAWVGRNWFHTVEQAQQHIDRLFH